MDLDAILVTTRVSDGLTARTPICLRAGEPTSLMARPNGAPEGIRTPNLLIRSQMLYPLSYGRSS